MRRSAAAKRRHEPPAPVDVPEKMPLNDGQKNAKIEILKAHKPKARHLLTGDAGSGKSHLSAEVVRSLLSAGRKVAMTAPTHKAVAVLRAKLLAAGLDHVPVGTIQSLLSLEPKPGHDGRTVLRRRKHAQPVEADVVGIDETSMVGTELHEHIERHLYHAFVLHIGDPAQIPPVGEKESPTFGIRSRSHLGEIVRQEADNPLLDAASIIRKSQGTGEADWSWVKSAKNGAKGVFLPGLAIDLWLQRAFTSAEFAKDNDTFRYVCWTNDRVARINAKVRHWIYGETEAPFCPDEKALLRQPVIIDDVPIFNTNEEVPVDKIEAGTYTHEFPKGFDVPKWSVEIPTWEIHLRRADDDSTVLVHLPRDDRLLSDINDRLVSEAQLDKDRWGHRWEFQQLMARMQHIYAGTVHTAQGATHRNTFLDVADIRRRERSNLLEMQQLLYTGATRPTTGLFLAGV